MFLTFVLIAVTRYLTLIFDMWIWLNGILLVNAVSTKSSVFPVILSILEKKIVSLTLQWSCFFTLNFLCGWLFSCVQAKY